MLLAQSSQAGFGRIPGAALLTKALLQGLLLLLKLTPAGLISQLLIAQLLDLTSQRSCAGLQALLLSCDCLELALQTGQHQTTVSLGRFQTIALGAGSTQGRVGLFELLLQLTPALI